MRTEQKVHEQGLHRDFPRASCPMCQAEHGSREAVEQIVKQRIEQQRERVARALKRN